MTDRQSFTLAQLAAPVKSAFSTGPFGSAVSSKNFRDQGIPMLRGANLSEHVGTRLNEADLVFLDEDLADRFIRSQARKGDLVFTCWGTVGQIGYIDDRARYDCYVVSNKQMKMTPDPAKVQPLFLYYYLSQPQMVSLVQGRAIGSSVPGFNLGQLKSLAVEIPDVDEQRAIANVLGALDDKIAANCQLILTSMTLGAAIYAEAVKGDEDSVRLNAIARHLPGKYLPRDAYAAGGPYRVYGSNSEMGSHREALYPGAFTVLARIGSYCGNLRWSQRPAWVNNNASALLPTNDFDPWVLRHVLERIEMAPHRGGSGQPFIRTESLMSTDVIVPASERVREIGPRLKSLAERETLAAEESRVLATTRDALLPPLMSGKLRVKDAEQQLEGVV